MIHYNKICIGILTIPHGKTIHGPSHIMKSFIDWIESCGASILVIPFDTPLHQINLYFQRINGLFIPGGDTVYIVKDTAFMNTITRFFELSIQQNEYFPIWGTCFGFQLLILLFGKNAKLSDHRCYQMAPIMITEEGRQSRLFSSLSPRFLHSLEHKKSTTHLHDLGISPSAFIKNEHLRRFYNILATSVDEKGKEYVAAIEAKHFPIYGVTWHPERGKKNEFITFFLSECCKNKHKTIVMPHVNTYAILHKCIQYNAHKKEGCYFF